MFNLSFDGYHISIENDQPELWRVIVVAVGVIVFGSVCSGIEAPSVAWHPLGRRIAAQDAQA